MRRISIAYGGVVLRVRRSINRSRRGIDGGGGDAGRG